MSVRESVCANSSQQLIDGRVIQNSDTDVHFWHNQRTCLYASLVLTSWLEVDYNHIREHWEQKANADEVSVEVKSV